MSQPELDEKQIMKNLNLAAKGAGALVGIALSFVVAVATGLGDWIDGQQADLFGGVYYPKLTMAIILVVVGLPVGWLLYRLLRPWFQKRAAVIIEMRKRGG